MDFTMTQEQTALRDAVRDLVSRQERSSEVGPRSHDPKAWAALAEMGLLGLTVAEDDGGMGASEVEAMVAATELGRGNLVTAYAPALLATSLLVELGGQGDLLAAAAAGEALVLPAIGEPGRTFDLTAHDVSAEPTDDGWALTGVKEPVVAAGDATHLLVTAHTSAGTGVFLVDGAAGEGDRVVLDATPATLLGSLEATRPALQRALATGLVVACAETVGAMEAALDLTRDYLRQRKQFGVPLAHFQALTHRAADMYVRLELARSAAQFAAMVLAEIPRGAPVDLDAVLRAKVVVGAAGRHVGHEAVQLHGGIGVTAEYAVSHLLTRVLLLDVWLGPATQHLADLATRVGRHTTVEVLPAG